MSMAPGRRRPRFARVIGSTKRRWLAISPITCPVSAVHCEVRQFEGGQSNPTYFLHAASGDYVLRKKPPGQLLPSAHAVDREYRVMKALAGTGVPVPPTHC